MKYMFYVCNVGMSVADNMASYSTIRELHLHAGHLAGTFIQSDLQKFIHTFILMVVAAMQGANQHIRRILGFSILPKDTLTCIIEPVTFQWKDAG